MKLMKLLVSGVMAFGLATAAHAAGGAKHPHSPEGGWEFDGPLGQFDQAAVQRGYQVYREVCASCHSMDLMSFRNLGEPGGPYYDPEYSANDNPQVKAFAADYMITDGPDDVGDMFERPGRPADTFRNPYPNAQAARAGNGGALPPDLSVIVKARSGGADYVYSLLVGYPKGIEDGRLTMRDPDHPEENGVLTQPAGLYYNPYFPGDTKPNWAGDPRHAPYGGFLAMAPQLTEGRVEYMDGTPATVEQMAHDVTAFLAWASEPKQAFRKSSGLSVILFLGVLSILLWFSYRRIWRNVEH